MNEMNKIDRPVAGESNMPMGWASDVAAEMLRRTGVKYVALNPGASYRGFHDSIVNYLGNEDPQMLLCLHEDHAVAISHGYATVTEEPMATILHSNVGLMHGLMGIFNAWCDRAPIIVMGATGPVDAPLRRPWIDWIHTCKDQGMLLRNFVKYDDEPRSAEAIVETMLRANIMARTPPMGPVYVCLDAGLQEQALDSVPDIPDSARFQPAEVPRASDETVTQAASMLSGAKNVVLLMGRVSRKQDDWDKRVAFAEKLGATVITDLKTPSSFPTNHPLHVGAPSNWVRPQGQEALKNADVILALDWIDLAGTFKALGVGYQVSAKVINCTLDSYVHNGWSADHFGLAPADIPVLSEPDVFIAQLSEELGDTSKWDGTPKEGSQQEEAEAPEKDPGEEIAPADIAFAVKQARGDRKISLSRVPLGWAGDAYHFTSPMDYFGNDGGGGLGSGAGNAIGVGLALKDTDRLPVAILGDGDFMQAGSALWTAAHYNIPVLFLISNNQSNFNDEVHQEAMAKERDRPVENRWIGQRITEPELDLASYARSQGVEAAGPITKVGDLAGAIDDALKVVESGKPFLLDVRVKPGYSAPMVTRASGEASTGSAS